MHAPKSTCDDDKLFLLLRPNCFMFVNTPSIYTEGQPSFAGTSSTNLNGFYSLPPKGWKGTCQADHDGTPFPCK
jgi:hypothetical protein